MLFHVTVSPLAIEKISIKACVNLMDQMRTRGTLITQVDHIVTRGAAQERCMESRVCRRSQEAVSSARLDLI